MRPPLSDPGQGFPLLEVLQVETIDGRTVLLFSCPPDETANNITPVNPNGSVWAAPAQSPIGPFAISSARQLVDDGRYSGRIIYSRGEGRWVFLAFDRDVNSPTFCQISDPQPIRWHEDNLAINSKNAEMI